ncbi:MAG: hypothetical protein KAJ79_00520 [Candidatus Omnitrophica bacterium]|nr:hypothetical protein [Candidatus Omnitrophota bacterium]
MNKFGFLFVLSLALFCLNGCQTVKNTGKIVTGTGDLLYGAGQEVVDVTYSSYKALDRADDWMQENLW